MIFQQPPAEKQLLTAKITETKEKNEDETDSTAHAVETEEQEGRPVSWTATAVKNVSKKGKKKRYVCVFVLHMTHLSFLLI